jgi:hypothetical protein
MRLFTAELAEQAEKRDTQRNEMCLSVLGDLSGERLLARERVQSVEALDVELYLRLLI